MAKSITASEVREGDRISNTFMVEDMAVTRQGVVAVIRELGGDLNFRTAKDYSLGPSEGTIVLLHRPAIELPTNPSAVVQYNKGALLWTGQLTPEGWRVAATYPDGNTLSKAYWVYYHEEFTEMVNHEDRRNYKVLFGGVAK